MTYAFSEVSIKSLIKTNLIADSSILMSWIIKSRPDYEWNSFHSNIFKYERQLTEPVLIPKHEFLQRSFIHRNFQTIFTTDAFLHYLRIKLTAILLKITIFLWNCSNLSKLVGNFLEIFQSFRSRVRFYWKIHCSLRFSKNTRKLSNISLKFFKLACSFTKDEFYPNF